ncbi:hypothetical protein WA158_000236 [Blastocystis sp. Blastoise]
MVWSKIRFPEQYMILLTKNVKDFSSLGPYQFRVDPSMTKLEAKEYLEKIYGVQIEKIHSVNFLGKLKRTPGKKIYREPSYKKLFVYLHDPKAPEKVEKPKITDKKQIPTLSYEGDHKEAEKALIEKIRTMKLE